MLTKYIFNAMQKANYELLPEGKYYGNIPECPGVWATASNLEDCRRELQEILEEWIMLKLQDKEDLPIINGIQLKIYSNVAFHPRAEARGIQGDFLINAA